MDFEYFYSLMFYGVIYFFFWQVAIGSVMSIFDYVFKEDRRLKIDIKRDD
jgi:hypothetical protein